VADHVCNPPPHHILRAPTAHPPPPSPPPPPPQAFPVVFNHLSASKMMGTLQVAKVAREILDARGDHLRFAVQVGRVAMWHAHSPCCHVARWVTMSRAQPLTMSRAHPLTMSRVAHPLIMSRAAHSLSMSVAHPVTMP
jgi:hypothetical protein